MNDSKSNLAPRLVDEIIGRGRLYEVGGSVRDSLIVGEIENKDRDYLVTGISIEELMALLRRYGKVDLVGKSFGVIKFTPRGNSDCVDIAIPRVERSTGIAHRDFDVNYDPSLPVETVSSPPRFHNQRHGAGDTIGRDCRSLWRPGRS